MTAPACAVCATAPGTQVDELPPTTWSLERDPSGDRWLCPGCTREHVRDIEAKLDRVWW